MKPTHCILYTPVDKTYKDKTETSGTCLNALDAKGNCLPCMNVIGNGYCSKKRKTPVM
jgi:hypothetical protein